MPTRFSSAELDRLTAAIFVGVGMLPEHAQAIAQSLVWANLRGVDTHGVMRAPRYLEMIDRGEMNLRPAMTIAKETVSSVLIAADSAPGPVALRYAADQAVEKAKQGGVALAVIAHTTHTGAMGYYTGRVAEAGLACIGVNATIPLMPYHGARGAALGTNPISIAVPGAGADPLLFDMATSIISRGKMLQARRTGAPLQPGWVVDDAGNPTTDAAAATMPLPLGGPKGSGLSLMIECLTSVLTGNPIIADALEKSGKGAAHRQNALLIAIDVTTFIALDEFRRQIDRLVQALKALPLAPGAEEILMPGERGARTMRERRVAGIPLPDKVADELAAVALRLGVAPLQPLP